tara:strand:- start:118 stop:267 length:150 start_codon:yes stop_codon:yes gene_type:complete
MRDGFITQKLFPTHIHQMVLNKQTKTNIHLSTMDLLVRATMKNAAKRDM